ncbi:CGNR zinc finger protein [Actinomadura pelletieri DSM 43383]|uniref:CGNR zinc finger protein n=1 Tax=Actinomadura pelletieri DSM 43383 TaxID=1120940 RepID=A0A495QZ63_9ACTN|nr:ABATE domain-containing protein [Actinomadura pelletieri]RKS79529.1 CGNR zinc finger protein [Actinomadura pelletieri DSM 43383]
MSDLVPLIGEPPALDLVNTRTAVGDLLTTTDDLRTWLRLEATRFPQVDALRADADLAAIRRLREHTSRLIDHARHGTPPPADDLKALNETLQAAPAITELSWNGSALTAARHRIGTPAAQLTAWLAEETAALLTDPAVTKIRQCEADDCVLLFLPAHPRRRWCSPDRCGNRTRVARHYHRHRS